MTSERDFLRQLQRRFPPRPPIVVGIGDDGAVLNTSAHEQQVIVTDMLLDGVHFDLRQTSPRLAGRKAMAVNLSDLAAMACRPTAAFVSLAIPRSPEDLDSFLMELYAGLAEFCESPNSSAADAASDQPAPAGTASAATAPRAVSMGNFCIAGGDTNVWDGPFAVNVCLTGVPVIGQPVLRSGAKPGDVLVVTGPLGGSLKSGRHLMFTPRLDTAAKLVSQFPVHAMMDITDGLAIDLHRMLEAGCCGAVVNAALVPIHPDVPVELPAEERLHRALSDGEDFELLLAIPAACAASSEFQGVLKTLPGAAVIGTITDVPGHCSLRQPDGTVCKLEPQGWQHL
ncbi:MAG: thiamine-monophosphate kinase [Planctomycetaceae bacterium]|nr:thiamine-monophosphate kinase [Planctomycetaceae bacterium]